MMMGFKKNKHCLLITFIITALWVLSGCTKNLTITEEDFLQHHIHSSAFDKPATKCYSAIEYTTSYQQHINGKLQACFSIHNKKTRRNGEYYYSRKMQDADGNFFQFAWTADAQGLKSCTTKVNNEPIDPAISSLDFPLYVLLCLYNGEIPPTVLENIASSKKEIIYKGMPCHIYTSIYTNTHGEKTNYRVYYCPVNYRVLGIQEIFANGTNDVVFQYGTHEEVLVIKNVQHTIQQPMLGQSLTVKTEENLEQVISIALEPVDPLKKPMPISPSTLMPNNLPLTAPAG